VIRQPKAERLALALVVLGTTFAASSCRTPTQATIEIVSELAYRPDMAVAVQLGTLAEVESAPARVVTRGPFDADGTVGTVVALPSDADDGEFVVRVVLGVGRDPATCIAADAKGCVVVRRTARFSAHESSRLRVVLRPTCLGTFCDAQTSCARDGACGSLESDQEVGDGGLGIDASLEGGGDPYAVAVLADRPRHFYRFDEPVGATVAKDAMGRADGTYQGAVRLGVTGALGTSENAGAYFDGRDASVVIPKLEDLPGASTFELWARDDGDASDPTAFERLDRVGGESFGYRLSRPPESEAAFAVFRGDLVQTAAAPRLRFAGYTYVVAVTAFGEITLYVDGAPAKRTTFKDGPPAPVLAPFVVGKSATGRSAWRGTIDELAVYDYPLTPQQIQTHRLAAGTRKSP